MELKFILQWNLLSVEYINLEVLKHRRNRVIKTAESEIWIESQKMANGRQLGIETCSALMYLEYQDSREAMNHVRSIKFADKIESHIIRTENTLMWSREAHSKYLLSLILII